MTKSLNPVEIVLRRMKLHGSMPFSSKAKAFNANKAIVAQSS